MRVAPCSRAPALPSRWLASGVAFVLFLSALLALTAAPVEAIMYPVTNNARPCFIEEVESHTSEITGSYLWHTHSLNSGTRLTLELRTPSLALLDTLELQPDKNGDGGAENAVAGVARVLGRPFSFRLPRSGPERETGPYQLCMQVEPPITGIKPEDPIFVSIDVDQAAVKEIRNQQREAEEMKEIAEGTEGEGMNVMMEYLQTTSRQILDLRRATERVVSYMEHHLGRVDRMQDTAESTFTRVWVMAVITITVVCVVVFGQFRWLSKTIVKKKLI